MKKITLLSLIGCLFLFSCQKEISWDTTTLPGGGGTDSTDTTPGNTNGVLLVRSVSVQNGETYTTTYSYTTDKKIEVINMTGTSGGISISNYRRFYRDDNGRIIKIAQKLPDQQGIEVDTAFTYVYYPDATTFNYNYTIMKLSLAGFEVQDSTLYTYNSNNQITEGYTYQSNPIFGPIQETKFTYAFDAAGNLIKITGYNNASGTMELVSTFDLEYDNKTNPLAFDKQEFLVSGGNPGSSKNNATVIKFKDVANPDEQVVNITYTFGANNLPATSSAKDLSDNTTTNTTYYYQ